MAAVYVSNIPQIYENVMQIKGMLWLRLPSSEQNRLPGAILVLWYFTVPYVLQYIIGTWYLVSVPGWYGRTPNFKHTTSKFSPYG